jgi:hypothetical protein
LYVAKAGAKARFKESDYIEIPDAYLRSSWALLRKISTDMASAALKVL